MLTAFSLVAEARRSMLSGMFSFMKKTSRVRHNPESEGIYLSDIKADELDPEVAALYFPSSHRGPSVYEGIDFAWTSAFNWFSSHPNFLRDPKMRS